MFVIPNVSELKVIGTLIIVRVNALEPSEKTLNTKRPTKNKAKVIAMIP